MKITNVKAMVAKALTVGLLAGAALLAAPAKASAQPVILGVQVGYPYYGYPGRGYYERRHEEWIRAHEYRCYPHYGYRGRW